MTRGILASLGVVVLVGLVGACGPSRPAYSAAEVKACSGIQARYSAAVVAACFDRYSFDDCPDVPALTAKRRAEQEAAGCR